MTLNPRQFRISEGISPDNSEMHQLTAHSGKQKVGHLQYHPPDERGEVDIGWVESKKPGAGTALVSHLADKHPDAKLTTAWFTDSGEGFAEKWNQRHPERPLAGYSGWRPGLDADPELDEDLFPHGHLR